MIDGVSFLDQVFWISIDGNPGRYCCVEDFVNEVLED